MAISPPASSLLLWQDVRTRDYRRFLAIQRAPAAVRPSLYALTAFYQEIASTAERVSEPMIGAIRLSWWREALDELEQGRPPRAHPVVEALAQLFATTPITPADLRPLITAREADLDPDLLATEPQFNSYLDATSGALHRLWGRCLTASPAGALSEAYALIGLARSIPFMAEAGVMRLPGFLCERHGLERSLSALLPSPAITDLTRHLCTRAEASLGEPQPKGPFAALRAIAIYDAAQLQKSGYDPFAYARERRASLGLVWRVLRS